VGIETILVSEPATRKHEASRPLNLAKQLEESIERA